MATSIARVGVRQLGCVAAPSLFNVAIDHSMRKSIEMVLILGVNGDDIPTDLCYSYADIQQ